MHCPRMQDRDGEEGAIDFLQIIGGSVGLKERVSIGLPSREGTRANPRLFIVVGIHVLYWIYARQLCRSHVGRGRGPPGN